MEKNKDVIVKIEAQPDSAVSAERLRKNIAVWYRTPQGGVAYRMIHA